MTVRILMSRRRAVAVFVFIIIVGTTSTVFAHDTEYRETQRLRDDIFVVQRTDTLKNVARHLKDDGHISNSVFFQIRWMLSNFNDPISPGGYTIPIGSSPSEVISALGEPTHVFVVLGDKLTRKELAEILGKAFDWPEKERKRFTTTYAAIQWNHFNGQVIDILGDVFGWKEVEKEIFAVASARYSRPEYDFLHTLYVPGEYLLARGDSFARISASLVERFSDKHAPYSDNFLRTNIDQVAAHNISILVQGEVENLPDLVPLPPLDVGLEWQNGRIMLVFTTTYWNQGEGSFELRAGEDTRGILGDIERDIFQRVYRVDGTWRDKLAGSFLWHQEHLHYHYADFVNYILEPEYSGQEGNYASSTVGKRTFCIRDVDEVDLSIPGASDGPAYEICGKERQGISVGWGDSYFFTYVDQNLDVTGFPRGRYRLTFDVNPLGIFEELSTDNNKVSALIDLDVDNWRAKVLE